jgi:hypothetical protein
MLLAMSLEYDIGPENIVYFYRAVESKKLMPSKECLSFIHLTTEFKFYKCENEAKSLSYVKYDIAKQIWARVYSLKYLEIRKNSRYDHINFWFDKADDELIKELNEVSFGHDVKIETSDEYKTVIMMDDQPLLTNNPVLINYRKDCEEISRFMIGLETAFNVLQKNDSTVVDIDGYYVFKQNGVTNITIS